MIGNISTVAWITPYTFESPRYLNHMDGIESGEIATLSHAEIASKSDNFATESTLLIIELMPKLVSLKW